MYLALELQNLILYMINTINIWSIVISLEYKQKQNKIIYLSDLNSLSINNPILAFILINANCSPPLFSQNRIFI